jgi:purine-binding chemotaxis protein CheW
MKAMTKAEAVPILQFQLGGRMYGLPIEDVVEVAAMVELLPLPGSPPEVLGVANRHGAVLPMLDLRRVFGVEAVPVNSASVFVVSVHGDRQAGLMVDTVERVAYVHPPIDTPSSGKYIRGIINDRGNLIQIIALSALMNAFLKTEYAEGH